MKTLPGLLVKGACDYVVHDGLIVDTICGALREAMEPTEARDSLTGLASSRRRRISCRPGVSVAARKPPDGLIARPTLVFHRGPASSLPKHFEELFPADRPTPSATLSCPDSPRADPFRNSLKSKPSEDFEVGAILS